MGQCDDAIKAYGQAIRLDPKFANAWNNKGAALHDQGKYDEAIKAYDRAINLDPNLAAAWIGKGNALNAQSKYNKTIKNNSQITPSLAINVPAASTAVTIQHGPFTISFDPGHSYRKVNTTGPLRLLGPDGKTWFTAYVLFCYSGDDEIIDTLVQLYKFDLPAFDLSSPFPTKSVYTDLISQGVDSNTIYTVPRTISGRPGVFGWGYSTESKSPAYEISWYISTKSVAHVFSYNEEEAGKIVNSIAISEYGIVTDYTSTRVPYIHEVSYDRGFDHVVRTVVDW